MAESNSLVIIDTSEPTLVNQLLFLPVTTRRAKEIENRFLFDVYATGTTTTMTTGLLCFDLRSSSNGEARRRRDELVLLKTLPSHNNK